MKYEIRLGCYFQQIDNIEKTYRENLTEKLCNFSNSGFIGFCF